MRIGFIGAGKVGVSLGKYFTEQSGRIPKEQLSGYYSKNPDSARWAADFTASKCYLNMEALVADSDIIFVTVPDGSIGEVVKELAGENCSAEDFEGETFPNENLAGKCFCHCSGAETSAIFEPLRIKGAYAYSIHPLCAVSSREIGYIALKEACFTVEGDEKYLSEVYNMFRSLGNRIEVIQPEQKVKYHMAAVFASNLVVGLFEEATKLLEECGLSEEFACNALGPLFINNAQNVAEKGTVQALTGPVERADISTVEKHLQVVSDRENAGINDVPEGTKPEAVVADHREQIYRLLSQSLVKIAEKKNSGRDYGALKKLLED